MTFHFSEILKIIHQLNQNFDLIEVKIVYEGKMHSKQMESAELYWGFVKPKLKQLRQNEDKTQKG